MGNPLFTCKHCLCFYLIVAVIDQCMLGLLVSTYTLFGSMPPGFPMAIGFWLLLYTNYMSQFVTLVAMSTFRRNMDIDWLNKLIEICIAIFGVLFLIGAILFLIPISAGGMMAFSKFYLTLYGEIPPFLDNVQAKLRCCGINSYLDYGKNLVKKSYGPDGFKVFRQATINDDFFHQLASNQFLDRTVARRTNGLNVPQSCCPFEKTMVAQHAKCGEQVEYTGAAEGSDLWKKQVESAKEKVNDPHMGCYDKLQNIVDVGFNFQWTFLLGTIKVMSIVQSIFFWSLLWFHRMALKSIRQTFWVPELQRLHVDLQDAEYHAHLEAEADAAHGRKELKSRSSGASIGSPRMVNIVTKRSQQLLKSNAVDQAQAKPTKAGGGKNKTK